MDPLHIATFFSTRPLHNLWPLFAFLEKNGRCDVSVWEDWSQSGRNMLICRYNPNLQHRISATGWLLFMRCVSFTFIRLLPTWTPTEIFDSFWAKHFFRLWLYHLSMKSKLKFLKVRKFWKGFGTFKQTECSVFLIAVVAVMLSVTMAPRVPLVNF